MAELPVKAFVEARCRERERLSKILHDEIAGGLTAAGLSLDLLALDVPAELTSRVREVQAVLERSFDSVRELSMEFHPDPATRFRLLPALESLAARFAKSFRGTLESRFSESVCDRLNPEQARACYAVAEASLDNVLLHSYAKRAWLTLDCAAGNSFLLTVQDDGKGIQESTTTRGTGTTVMEYHVIVAGLKLLVQSEVGRGTWVQVSPAQSVLKTKRGSHADGD